MKKTIVLIMIVLFSINTGSIDLHAQNNRTMLVGQINYQGYDYPEYNGESLNGYFGEGLYVIINDLKSGEIFVIVAGKDGIFTEYDMEPGWYRLQELVNSRYMEGAGRYVSTSWRPLYPMIFEAEHGKVNNLGTFVWETVYNYEYNEAIEYSCFQDFNFFEVFNNFKTNNPASALLDMEWIPAILDEEGETLLIGTIYYKGEGFHNWGDFSLDGVILKNLVLTLEEDSTGITHTLRTDSQGFFTRINMPQDHYWIRSLLYRIAIGDDEAWVTWQSYDYFFYLEEGKVNNIGIMYWIVEYDEMIEDTSVNEIVFNNAWGDIEEYIKEEYAASKWSLRPWTEVYFRTGY